MRQVVLLLMILTASLCLGDNGNGSSNDKGNDKADVKKMISQGNKLYKTGDYENAEKMYSQALELDENNAVAQYNRGNALFKLGKSSEAVDEYLKSAAQGGSEKLSSRSKYNLASAYLKQISDELQKSGDFSYNKDDLNKLQPDQIQSLLETTESAVESIKDAGRFGQQSNQLLQKMEAARSLQRDLKQIMKEQQQQQNQDQNKDDQQDKNQDEEKQDQNKNKDQQNNKESDQSKDKSDSDQDQQGQDKDQDSQNDQNQKNDEQDEKDSSKDQQKQDDSQDQSGDDQKDKQQDSGQDKEKQNKPQQGSQKSRADASKADDIIEKENQNKKKRALIPARYRKVEKDW